MGADIWNASQGLQEWGGTEDWQENPCPISAHSWAMPGGAQESLGSPGPRGTEAMPSRWLSTPAESSQRLQAGSGVVGRGPGHVRAGAGEGSGQRRCLRPV